jgi:hypothetical protein
MAGDPKYMIPLNKRDPEEARAIQSMGGKASVQARRAKKLLSQQIAEYFGEKDMKTVLENMTSRCDNVTMSLIAKGLEIEEKTKDASKELETDKSLISQLLGGINVQSEDTASDSVDSPGETDAESEPAAD